MSRSGRAAALSQRKLKNQKNARLLCIGSRGDLNKFKRIGGWLIMR